MVYYGKPSKACESCRKRRLKCDQQRPTCSPCRNAGRICPGYRDLGDLAFRNETDRIIAKHKEGQGRKSLTSTGRPPPSLTTSGADNEELTSQVLIRERQRHDSGGHRPTQTLCWPVEDIAINHALGNYLCGSHFAYLPAMYASGTSSQLLRSVLAAAGLAAILLQSKCHELGDTFNLRYLNAIKQTNQALHCAETATHDDVLVSIMLLAQVENLRRDTAKSIQAWDAHIQGALALITVRGATKLQSQRGRTLFKHVSDSISVYCVQNTRRIPAALRQLTAIISDPQDVNFGFGAMVNDFTDLKADLAEGLATNPVNVIGRAEDILRHLEDLVTNMPSEWSPEIMQVNKPSIAVLGEYYFLYTDKNAAQLWNSIWQMRLMLNDLIREQINCAMELTSPSIIGDPDFVQMALNSRRNSIEAAIAICASVPAFFLPMATDYIQEIPVDVARGYFLIWPLFTAGSWSTVPVAIKDYVIERLIFISATLNVPQALEAAVALADGDLSESSSW